MKKTTRQSIDPNIIMTCLKNIGHLKLRLDASERLVGYSLGPLNCRRNSRISLLPYIGNRPAESIMTGSLEQIAPETKLLPEPLPDILRQHLAAIQAALHLYGGDPSVDPPVDFSLENIRHDSSGTEISGYITYAIAASEYPECRQCRITAERPDRTPRRHPAGV